MTDSRVALDPDRLPWLKSEPKSAIQSGWSLLVTWGVALLLMVAGGAYWLGRTTDTDAADRALESRPFEETIALPEVADGAEMEPAPVPVPAPAARIEPAPPPPVEATRPQRAATPARQARSERKVERRAAAPRKVTAARSAAAKKTVKRPARARIVKRRPAWPNPATALNMGRMINLGTYSSAERLERAYAYRARRYPQLRNLPRITAPYKAANGKIYYRLHVMTAARGQSDWLCRKIRSEWRTCRVLRPASAA